MGDLFQVPNVIWNSSLGSRAVSAVLLDPNRHPGCLALSGNVNDGLSATIPALAAGFAADYNESQAQRWPLAILLTL